MPIDPKPIARTTFETRDAFREHLALALERAQGELWMADRDFGDWPIAEASFAGALQVFLRQSAEHRLRILTLRADRFTVAAPRLLSVLRAHAHNAHCRIVPSHAAARFGEACSMLIADRSLVVRRFHRDRARGVAELDPAGARPWLEQFETLWDESSPILASTVLGLS